MFDSQVSLVHRSQRFGKRNIQEFRPGRSAMQWHCGLRLFFKNIYSTYSTYVHYCTFLYMVCSIKTSFIFRFDKRAQYDPVWGWLLKRPLFSSFENRARISCLVSSLFACRFVFRSGSLDIVEWDASLVTRDDTSNQCSSGLPVGH